MESHWAFFPCFFSQVWHRELRELRRNQIGLVPKLEERETTDHHFPRENSGGDDADESKKCGGDVVFFPQHHFNLVGV